MRQRFIAAAKAACVKRVNRNAGIARDVGLREGTNDFAVQMAYVERSLETADDLVAELSALEQPPGDATRVEGIVTSLAQSNVAMRSAVDSYSRFGASSPAFQEDLDKAAELESKFNASAAAYGIRECG